ncbi:hypothetical protein Bbelb_428140 [Branchiostoma belcheri]|nr:hypothetical protein Bbelb_428140 [Branchiostoma belcheri]
MGNTKREPSYHHRQPEGYPPVSPVHTGRNLPSWHPKRCPSKDRAGKTTERPKTPSTRAPGDTPATEVPPELHDCPRKTPESLRADLWKRNDPNNNRALPPPARRRLQGQLTTCYGGKVKQCSLQLWRGPPNPTTPDEKLQTLADLHRLRPPGGQ